MSKRERDRAVFHQVTVDSMICKHCLFKGTELGFPAGRCEVFEFAKPSNIIAEVAGAKCEYFVHEDDL